MTISLIALKTIGIRHAFVKILAPSLYKNAFETMPRPMITFLKDYYKSDDLTGVEIGVGLGNNAESILKTLSIRKLFLIDPYLSYHENGRLITQSAKSILIAKNRLSNFEDKIKFIYKKSFEALTLVPNNLDFVYIDGNHEYDSVKQDIQLYYPKIKEDGVIGGHDFSSDFFGLCKAVFEFVNNNNLNLCGKKIDWWVTKQTKRFS